MQYEKMAVNELLLKQYVFQKFQSHSWGRSQEVVVKGHNSWVLI